ncbi:hypothetical protein GGR56DRAFT_671435 [Xylariaceae sp. FL0804]|nr:hypothetical protein GGR56DRAFT_671435 [Xylariaceae sp. FL0804]
MFATRILRASKPNITGFDAKQFARAAGQPKTDPWYPSEAWRYEGEFSRWSRFKHSFPGLGIATVAFGVYLAYEQLFMKDEHHGEGHGEGHH